MFMNLKIMVKLIRLHLKMWVQVAVLTELHTKKPIPLHGNWFFGVCFVSVMFDGLKEICFFVV
ncbi:hypothetical protein BK758_33130 [Bacillus thuringiensis serovar aizawai]|nr:hypothetical protein BK758_33130 [Bacillus thuringiensis serovar aizawai]OUA16323.1 hypothetical protein BK777_26950 [Bacillus thuringiensis serovar aizawai]PNK41018.1 hypothetical protein CBR57_32060 [Bacillus thuringiensis]